MTPDQIAELERHGIKTLDELLADWRRMREALETADSWLDRWGNHVGRCGRESECTCGLARVQHEIHAALEQTE